MDNSSWFIIVVVLIVVITLLILAVLIGCIQSKGFCTQIIDHNHRVIENNSNPVDINNELALLRKDINDQNTRISNFFIHRNRDESVELSANGTVDETYPVGNPNSTYISNINSIEKHFEKSIDYSFDPTSDEYSLNDKTTEPYKYRNNVSKQPYIPENYIKEVKKELKNNRKQTIELTVIVDDSSDTSLAPAVTTDTPFTPVVITDVNDAVEAIVEEVLDDNSIDSTIILDSTNILDGNIENTVNSDLVESMEKVVFAYENLPDILIDMYNKLDKVSNNLDEITRTINYTSENPGISEEYFSILRHEIIEHISILRTDLSEKVDDYYQKDINRFNRIRSSIDSTNRKIGRVSTLVCSGNKGLNSLFEENNRRLSLAGGNLIKADIIDKYSYSDEEVWDI